MDEIRVLFSLFGQPVTAWALCTALSAAAGAGIAYFLGRKRKVNADAVSLFVPLCLGLGILLGHGLFALVAGLLDPYVCEGAGMTLIGYVFNPLKGGYMGLGAIAALMIASLITGRTKKASFQETLKIGLPAVLAAIGGAKWGEWLCGQGTGPEAMSNFFPVSFTPEPDYPEWRVIAVFWLGGIYALCLAAWGISGALRGSGPRPVTLLTLYMGGQVFLDMLREDSYVHYLAMNFVRMDQLFSVLVMAGFMVWASVKIRKAGGRGIVRWWVIMLLSVGLCVGLQFLFDKPLPLFGALIYPPGWLVYALIGLTAAGMVCATLGILRRARQTA